MIIVLMLNFKSIKQKYENRNKINVKENIEFSLLSTK